MDAEMINGMKIRRKVELYTLYKAPQKGILQDSPELLMMRGIEKGDTAKVLELFPEHKQFSDKAPVVDTPYGRFEGKKAIGEFAESFIKTMKKCLKIMLVLTLVTVLTGCSKKETGKESDIKNGTETVKNESIGNKSEAGIDMAPIETDLDGFHNGVFVVTIDGNKYRYKSIGSMQINNLTYGEMIYKWDNNKGNVYEFYTVKEHPDYKYLKCIYNEYGHEGEVLIEYAPSEGLPEGALEEIINDGFVVMKNGSAISGEDKWFDFVKKTEVKEPAEIRIAFYFTLHGRMAKNLYELTKMDYPNAYFYRLKYDGTNYIFTPLQKSDESDEKYIVKPDDENDWEETYKYMKHYTGEAPSDTSFYSTFDKYVLVNDETVTWDDIWNGMISSGDFGTGIKNVEVFNKYDYKDGVDPDEVITVDN